MIKIGIIGSRDFPDKAKFLQEMQNEFREFTKEIITGGAPGVDSWAEEYGKKNGITVTIIRPIDKTKKLDYLFRNVEIISLSDKIIAFWDGTSRGTKFTIEYAKARGKDIKLIMG